MNQNISPLQLKSLRQAEGKDINLVPCQIDHTSVRNQIRQEMSTSV